MRTYIVTWFIDIEAESPEEAAAEALDIMRDEDSTATIFDVKWDGNTKTVEVNCELDDQDARLQ
jgi:hypothetical protein